MYVTAGKIPEPEECLNNETKLFRALDSNSPKLSPRMKELSVYSLPQWDHPNYYWRINEIDSTQRMAEERSKSSIEMRSLDMLVLPTSFSISLLTIRWYSNDHGGIVNPNGRGPNPQQLIWFRSRAQVAADPAFQKCVIAYASDFSFIGTAARACGLSSGTNPKLGMLASLDHTIHFYDDSVDASDWLLFYVRFIWLFSNS